MTSTDLILLRALVEVAQSERDARARKVEAYTTGVTEDGRHHTVSTKWEDYWRTQRNYLDGLLGDCLSQWPEIKYHEEPTDDLLELPET